MSTPDPSLSSGARELLKWIALLTMTGDHVAKVVYGGYLPVISELGRIAFPLFALVMACNLAQPGADLRKSIRRLAVWGVIAQPLHALASNRPLLLLLAAGMAPMLVDYHWAGVGFVLLGWLAFRHGAWWLLLIGLGAVCWANHNGWALLAIPVVLAIARVRWRLPRWRWAFYGYYIGHLALLALYVKLRG